MMSLSPDRLLIVEDEVILGLDLRDALQAMGHLTIDLAHTLRVAQSLAGEHEYRFAVLDLNLGLGENSVALGLALSAAGTRVVFTSGYGADEVSGIEKFPLIAKPFEIAEVVAALGLTVCSQP